MNYYSLAGMHCAAAKDTIRNCCCFNLKIIMTSRRKIMGRRGRPKDDSSESEDEEKTEEKGM